MDRLANILVAIDFSDCSRAALVQAVRIAAWNNAKLHLLHVIEPLVITNLAAALHTEAKNLQEQICQQARAKLIAWLEEIGGRGEIAVAVGIPIQEVLARVRAVGADLLVAGARGSSAPTHGAGTLATKLARKAPTKVLLISERGTAPFRKIVACVDFSPTSSLVVEQAMRVAAREGGQIHCLHVFNPPWEQLHYLAPTPEAAPDFQKQFTDALQGRLEAFVGRHEGFDLQCVLFPCSSCGRGIVQYARQVNADLVILGTHGQTTLRYLVMGSTAERLLRELPCSVLTVRSPTAENILPVP